MEASQSRLPPVTMTIPLMMIPPVGERQSDGSYKEGTVNYLVNRRLQEMAEKIREFQFPSQL